MNNEPNKPVELSEEELEGVVGGSGTGASADPWDQDFCIIIKHTSCDSSTKGANR